MTSMILGSHLTQSKILDEVDKKDCLKLVINIDTNLFVSHFNFIEMQLNKQDYSAAKKKLTVARTCYNDLEQKVQIEVEKILAPTGNAPKNVQETDKLMESLFLYQKINLENALEVKKNLLPLIDKIITKYEDKKNEYEQTLN